VRKQFGLSLFLKVDREGAEVTLGDRLFQARAAATGKARTPTVENGRRTDCAVIIAECLAATICSVQAGVYSACLYEFSI